MSSTSSSLPLPKATVTISAHIPIVPKPQARPRFGSMPPRNSGSSKRRMCMSDPTKQYKRTLLHEFTRIVGEQGMSQLPLQGPVFVAAEFVFSRPASHYTAKKKRKAGCEDCDRKLTARARQLWTFHVQKPDIDNLLKALMDSLNSVAYADDAQVTRVECSKRYAEQDEASGIRVTLRGAPS